MGIETLVLSIIATIGTTSVLVSNLLYVGLTAAIGLGVSYLASSLLVQKPAIPRPEDGSYNLKQNVPSLPIVYGTVKKGGDYVFLEEKNGTAYHILVWCGRRINGFTQHYLHDDQVTLDGNGWVTEPSNFAYGGLQIIRILSRVGANASTAYSQVVSAFPSNIWSNSHRGDGLATVMMSCKTVSQKRFLKVYPNQMPEHSAVGEGALLYDPRKDSTQPGGSGSHRYNSPTTWEFSRNLALIRLDHLTKPYGGKLSYADMYMPDWMNAADVCDEFVVNRSGNNERRYHGGFWFRCNNDPVEVGRIIDEAAELVVYERRDGKIGVHAGEYVAPTVRLTATEIFSISVDKNRRKSANVLAVRGRYVNRSNNYVSEDAALYGDPYGLIDETERTKTLDNQAIQSHNHCQRKQKLTLTRSNARRVSIVADYAAGSAAAYSRFVTVHYPSRGMVEAVIEVTSGVTRDLRNMTVSFSGIIVSSSLYDFDASTEEGAPGSSVDILEPEGLPVPSGFSVAIFNEVVSGGDTAAYAKATWTALDESLVCELEWEPTDASESARSVLSEEGATSVRSSYLADGKEYKFRLRAWGGGTFGEWTSYETLTATADPVAPGVVTNVSVTPAAGEAEFDWKAPNSSNYFATRIYVNTTNSLGSATLVAVEYGSPNANDSRTVTLPAGTYYAWLRAINSSGVAASAVATGSFVVT